MSIVICEKQAVELGEVEGQFEDEDQTEQDMASSRATAWMLMQL